MDFGLQCDASAGDSSNITSMIADAMPGSVRNHWVQAVCTSTFERFTFIRLSDTQAALVLRIEDEILFC